MHFQIAPLQNITTERLIIRPLEVADAAEILLLRSNKEVIRYVHRPLYRFEAEAVEFIKKVTENIVANKSAYWGIFLKETGRLAGTICLWNMEPENFRSEIGYEMLPVYQHNGYMYEAAKAVTIYAFSTLKLHTITAWFNPENTASEKLLQKLGFSQEARFKDCIFHEGKFHDMVVYTLFQGV